MFYRKINDNEWEKISNKSNINEIEDSPLISDEIKSLEKYTISYRVDDIQIKPSHIQGHDGEHWSISITF